MTKDLIIIGAGGTGRVVADAIEDISNEWNLLGYLDDDPKKQGTKINGFPVLGKTDDAVKYQNCFFVIIMGSPRNYFIRKRVATKLGISLENYATIIHPDARVSRYTDVGKGSVIMPGVAIMPNVKIGNHTVILSHAYMGHDVKIGDYVTIANSTAIAGGVIINEGCYIGQNSSIRERITIGEWSLVGMGSVVVSDVLAYHVVAGNPA
ncbi:MAG TPA: acetyltransferase, partial [Dehalococcoidales bacterium]|nr:acetyltransferase [Dehalococcoidales bacterium]